MNKKQIFYNFTDFENLKIIGQTWINKILGYIPIGIWINQASVSQIGLWALNDKTFGFIHIVIPDWFNWMTIFLFLAVKFYFMMLISWIAGRLTIKVGLRDAELQYEAKQKHINPYIGEVREQLQEIAKKVGAENKFTKL